MNNKERKPYHICGTYRGKSGVHDCEASDIHEAIGKAEEYGYTNITEVYLVRE